MLSINSRFQIEARDLDFEAFPVVALHDIVAAHATRERLQHAEAVVLVGCTGLNHWLLTDDAFAFHFIDFARFVSDVPVTTKELNGLNAIILDSNEVSENELAVHHVRLPVQVHWANGDFDVSGYGVIWNHAKES